MSTIDEKRVYGDRGGARTAYVASAIGLAAVSISGASVGEFGLIHRGETRDVAVDAETLVVATAEDVHVLTGASIHADCGPDDLAAESGTDFGPAKAVGVDGEGRALAAKGDGRLARYAESWEILGTIPAAVRAFGRDTVVAADGVRSLSAIERSSLDDVRDVADPGPVVATATGVFRHTGGTMDEAEAGDDQAWQRERNGSTDRVAVAGSRLAAVSDGALLLKGERNWDRPVDADAVRDVGAAGNRFYAVTAAGDVSVQGAEGWRTRSIGLRDARRLAIV